MTWSKLRVDGRLKHPLTEATCPTVDIPAKIMNMESFPASDIIRWKVSEPQLINGGVYK